MCSLITCISHTQFAIMSGVAVVFCNASALHRIGPLRCTGLGPPF